MEGEPQRIGINVEPVSVLPVSKEDLTLSLILKFNRVASLDMALSDYLSALTAAEPSFSPEYVQVLEEASRFIRHGMFSVYLDIRQYGTPQMLSHAEAVFALSRAYRQEEMGNRVIFRADPKYGMQHIQGFLDELIGVRPPAA